MSAKFKADLLLTCCAVIWGTSFAIVKDALSAASVFVFLALRFTVAAAVLALLYRRELSRLRFRTGAFPAGTLMGGLLFAGFALQTSGIKFTTPSKAAFITGFSVILVPIFLAVFARARIKGWVWIGALSALVGLYYLTVPAFGALGSRLSISTSGVGGPGALNSGDLLVLCAAVLFAVHIIAVGHYTGKYSAGALSVVQVGTMSLLALAAVSLLAITHAQKPRVIWTAGFIVAVLVTAVLATALAFAAQIWAQQHTSATHAAILFTLEPVFAALTSFLFLHERLGGRALAGGTLILAGILLAEWRGPAPAAAESLTNVGS